MNRRRRALILCLLAGTAAPACHWWNSPERQIRRVLDAIAEDLSHETQLTTLAAAAAAAGIQEHLSPDVVIESDGSLPPLAGRDAAGAAAVRLLVSTPFLRIQFEDVRLASVGRPAAEGGVDVACNVTIETQDRAGQPTTDARELNVTMRQVEGRWVVGRVRAVNVLEPVS